MNDGSAPEGASPNSSPFIVARVQDAVGAVVWAQEAISLGEPAVAYAVLEDLKHDLRELVYEAPPSSSNTCERCLLTFRWPGALLDHLDLVHGKRTA
jgi:hypothetical protein